MVAEDLKSLQLSGLFKTKTLLDRLSVFFLILIQVHVLLIFFLERQGRGRRAERERDRQREREPSTGWLSHMPQQGTEPATQACA